MPNAHATDKEALSFYLPRTLATRVRKLARARSMNVTQLIEGILTHAVTDIVLTSDDYKAIAEATRAAERARSARTEAQDRRRRPKGSS